MKNIRMGRNLYLHPVNLHQPVSVLNIFLINEMVRIAGIHNDNYPILDSLLTNGEHNLVELFLTGPFLGFITDKCRDTLNGFQLGRLISGRRLDTTEHDTAAGHPVYNIGFGCFEILRCSVPNLSFPSFPE